MRRVIVKLRRHFLARHGLADEALRQRSVAIEVERFMRLLAWMHPALAQEVLRICKAKVDARVKERGTTVVKRASELTWSNAKR